MDFTFSTPPFTLGTTPSDFGPDTPTLHTLPADYSGPASFLHTFDNEQRMVDVYFLDGHAATLSITLLSGDTLEGINLDTTPETCATECEQHGFANVILSDGIVFYEHYAKLSVTDDIIDAISWWDANRWEHESFIDDACPELY